MYLSHTLYPKIRIGRCITEFSIFNNAGDSIRVRGLKILEGNLKFENGYFGLPDFETYNTKEQNELIKNACLTANSWDYCEFRIHSRIINWRKLISVPPETQ
jgi:hypothetical protein